MKKDEKCINSECQEPKKRPNVGLIIVLIVAMLIIGGVAYYIGVLATPVNIYRGIVTSSIDNLFEGMNEQQISKGKQSVDMEFDLTLSLDDEKSQKHPSVKALNAIDLAMNVQLDNNTNDYVVHFNTTYDKEKLLNGSIFVNLKNTKAYIYFKDYLDRYLELDLEEMDANSLQQSEKTVISKKAQSIIKKEFSEIITEDMCYKKDGSYILKTTNKELLENIAEVVEELAENEEFLGYYENKDEIKELLESYIESIQILATYMDKNDIEIALEDLNLLLRPKRITAKLDGVETTELVVNIESEKVSFDVEVENKNILNGYVTVKKVEDKDKVKFNLYVADMGTIVVDVKMSSKEIKELDKVDASKTKKIEELSMSETMELMNNLEKSKLGEIIKEIEEYNQSIIDKANQAIKDSNLAQVRNIAALAWAEAYVDGRNVEDAVWAALRDAGINLDEYTIVVESTGVTVTPIDDNNEYLY